MLSLWRAFFLGCRIIWLVACVFPSTAIQTKIDHSEPVRMTWNLYLLSVVQKKSISNGERHSNGIHWWPTELSIEWAVKWRHLGNNMTKRYHRESLSRNFVAIHSIWYANRIPRTHLVLLSFVHFGSFHRLLREICFEMKYKFTEKDMHAAEMLKQHKIIMKTRLNSFWTFLNLSNLGKKLTTAKIHFRASFLSRYRTTGAENEVSSQRCH